MSKSFDQNEYLEALRFNYHHLHYFWAVASEGHLTRAAERLHLSQSALSAQIRQLEQRLGVELFERQGRRLVLTEAGGRAFEYAQAIFGLGKELWNLMRDGAAGKGQALRIGHTPTLSRNFIDNWLRPAMAQPDVALNLHSAPQHELLSRLAEHGLDVVLTNRLPDEHETRPWRVYRLSRQRVSLVGPASWRDKPFRFPRDLAAQPLILPGTSSDIRARFDALCDQHGIAVTVAAQADDMAMLRLLARDSGLLAVLPPVVVQDELQGGRLVELQRLRGIDESFYAITLPRRFMPPMLGALLKGASKAAEFTAPAGKS
ncbi:MAG: LysR family transcriptional regulator [Burkholderiaceae bacterium]